MCANIDKKAEIVMENNEKSSRLYRNHLPFGFGHDKIPIDKFSTQYASLNFIIFVSVRF